MLFECLEDVFGQCFFKLFHFLLKWVVLCSVILTILCFTHTPDFEEALLFISYFLPLLTSGYVLCLANASQENYHHVFIAIVAALTSAVFIHRH